MYEHFGTDPFLIKVGSWATCIAWCNIMPISYFSLQLPYYSHTSLWIMLKCGPFSVTTTPLYGKQGGTYRKRHVGILSPETGKSCTEESSGEVSQEMIIALCAGCGGTALLVATCCLIAAALHHWRFRRQFGSHKEALTWEAYELKT